MTGTIFVIAEDVSFSRSVARLLLATGYEAREFATIAELPAEAIGPGDCLLVDPTYGRSAFDLLADRGINAPTVLMSGRDRDAVATASGTRPYLVKPFSQTQLRLAIEAATGNGRHNPGSN
jgi:FixJ family two-component response regulator